MNESKSAFLSRYTDDSDSRVRLSHMLDCLRACENRSIPTATAFLTPLERELCERILRTLTKEETVPEYVFWGGAAQSERTVLVFSPDWTTPMDWLEGDDSPLAFVRVVNKEAGIRAPLTHRDYLGALMGAGLRRDAVGDLYVRDDGCDLAVLQSVRDFVTEEFRKAGRASLTVTAIAAGALQIPEPKTKELRATVASLRLDAVLGEAFNMPRSKAAAAVEAGHVTLAHQICQKPDAPVRQGDVLTWKGQGRAELAEVGGLSRKGRITLKLIRYL